MAERNRSYLPLALAFLVGLVIGWFVLGWLLAPVKWTGALLQDLRAEDQQMLLAEQAQSYALTRDATAAGTRLEALGDKAHVSKLAEQAIEGAQAAGNTALADQLRSLAGDFKLDVPDLAAGQAPASAPVVAGETPASEAKDNAGRGGGAFTWLGLLLLLAGIAAGAWYLLRTRGNQQPAYNEPMLTTEPLIDEDRPVYRPELGAPVMVRPVAAAAERSRISQQFTAAYTQGDLEYDESFDIEGSDGSYWGECGMTTSEALASDGNRVTALEVWLFDKSDIRTVTKVLMSDFAYGNQALREKLSSRGDAVLLAPNLDFVLDAQTLRLMGKVVEMEYDDSQGPARAAIRRLRVQLHVLRHAG